MTLSNPWSWKNCVRGSNWPARTYGEGLFSGMNLPGVRRLSVIKARLEDCRYVKAGADIRRRIDYLDSRILSFINLHQRVESIGLAGHDPPAKISSSPAFAVGIPATDKVLVAAGAFAARVRLSWKVRSSSRCPSSW